MSEPLLLSTAGLVFAFPVLGCDGIYGVTTLLPKMFRVGGDIDKRYRAALVKHETQSETIEKELLGFTLHFPSIENAYSCTI